VDGVRTIERGSMYPPEEIERIIQVLRERTIASTRQVAKGIGRSCAYTKVLLAFLFGKGRVGCVEVEEKYAVVDASLKAKYWYLVENEERVITWLAQNSRILRWKKLVP